MSGKLVWRTSPPTSEGFYFVQPEGLTTRVVLFVKNGGRIEGGPTYLRLPNTRYAGPLPYPVEPDWLPVPETLAEEIE